MCNGEVEVPDCTPLVPEYANDLLCDGVDNDCDGEITKTVGATASQMTRIIAPMSRIPTRTTWIRIVLGTPVTRTMTEMVCPILKTAVPKILSCCGCEEV